MILCQSGIFFLVTAEAFSAALLPVTDVELRFDIAKVSVTAISQTVFFSAYQGVNVRPTGCFASVWWPIGSLMEEITTKCIKDEVHER